jgi:hypothetical protein
MIKTFFPGDLLRGFVLDDWVKDLDFATLERVSDG